MLYNEKDLMLKFLTRNYPVYRTKQGRFFRRTIYHDDGYAYILSDKNLSKKLYYELKDTLRKIFDTPDDINREVLKIFLHLEPDSLNKT